MKYCIVSVMIICSSILWVSCTDRALETSLKLSGENRAELERVLLHYKDNPEKKKARYYTPSYVPDLRPSSLLGIKVGACLAYTALGRYIYRSIGVPLVSDFTPNWANHKPDRMDAMETMKRAFDGNVLSSPKTVKTQTDAWVGLDLGRVVSVSELVFMPL